MFWIARKNFWTEDRNASIVFLICSFWVIAIAGARQTFFAFGIALLMRYLLFSKSVLEVRNIMKICTLAIAFLTITELIGSSYYDQFLFSEDTGSRFNRDFNTPGRIMTINPLFGVGFGCYSLYTYKNYPHNIFLELICELGIVGLLIMVAILICFLATSPQKNFLRFCTANNSYIFLFAIIFFLRSQISGDMADSMSFICFLLACEPSYKSYNGELQHSYYEQNEILQEE